MAPVSEPGSISRHMRQRSCMSKPWLFRLVYNHCMSLHKIHQMHLRHLQPMRDGYGRHMTPSEGSGLSFEESVLRKEMVMLIRNRINALPSRLREPVILYYFHGMLHRDIAAHLRLTPENVRKRLQHARHHPPNAAVAVLFTGDHGALWEHDKDGSALTTPDLLLPNTDALPAESLDQLASRVVAIRVVRVVCPKGNRNDIATLPWIPNQRDNSKNLQHSAPTSQRHPTGWRKHLQLADLLCTVGQWQEAVAAYQTGVTPATSQPGRMATFGAHVAPPAKK